MSELAMIAWEALEAWPEARESLMDSLVAHGGQIKAAKDGTEITKKPNEEWVYVGNSDFIAQKPQPKPEPGSGSSSSLTMR